MSTNAAGSTEPLWQRFGPPLLLIAAAVAAYWPALHGGFIWDDDALVTFNPLVKASDGLYRIWFTTQAIDYWPVTNSAFWIEWRLWGVNAAGYHVTNLVLHAASACVFGAILRRLSVPGAWLAAGLFALHPVAVQSVAWIAERKNTLSLLLFLLSLAAYLRSSSLCEPPAALAARAGTPDRRRGRSGRPAAGVPESRPLRVPLDVFYWLSLFAFVLAMLSKGSVAVMPAILLLLIWWKRNTITRGDLLRLAPFFVVAVALTLLNIWFQGRGNAGAIRDVTIVQRVFGAGAVIWFYLYKALWPARLVFIYPQWSVRPDDWRWWVPLAAAVAVTAALIRQRQRPVARPLLVAWGCFCLALIPVMGLTDVYFMKYSLVADHYQYLAVLAVAATTGAGLAAATRRFPIAQAAGLVAIFLLGVATWQQSRQYVNAETVYRTTLARNPAAWMAHNNLGLYLLRGSETDFDEGVSHLQAALAANPSDPSFHNNVGIAMYQLGRFAEAAARHGDAVRLKPTYADAYSNLGADYQKLGRHTEAVTAYQRALQLNPGLPIRSSLAAALEGVGKRDEASAELTRALQENPITLEQHGGTGDTLLRLGRFEEAIAQYREALRLDPNSAQIMNNLGFALMNIGQLDEAERQLRRAAHVRPKDSAIHDNLGNVLAQTQRLDEAVAEFRLALDNGSGVELAEIHNDMGVALAKLGRREEAIVHFLQALGIRPDLAAAKANLAKAKGKS